ncbi:MAG: sortase [Patescibacteria group bacterium]|jgi:sortase A
MTHHLITLEEIEEVFTHKKRKRLMFWINIFKYALLFIVLTIVIFYSFNYQAYLKRLKHFNNSNEFNQLTALYPQKNIDASKLILPALYPTKLTDNTIYIPKISVKAPIIWNVPDGDILEQLKNGIAHYRGTAIPGENGNIFLVGHSSNYWWIKSNYNDVFALLDKLENKDQVFITYEGKEYIYEIYNKTTVKPDQVEVMDNDNFPTVSLMTCVPVGTSLNRLIISAKQISPKTNEEAETIIPSALIP